MDQRISVVTLGVKHLEIAKRFYVEGLGWKPPFENDEIIFFQAGGTDGFAWEVAWNPNWRLSPDGSVQIV